MTNKPRAARGVHGDGYESSWFNEDLHGASTSKWNSRATSTARCYRVWQATPARPGGPATWPVGDLALSRGIGEKRMERKTAGTVATAEGSGDGFTLGVGGQTLRLNVTGV